MFVCLSSNPVKKEKLMRGRKGAQLPLSVLEEVKRVRQAPEHL